MRITSLLPAVAVSSVMLSSILTCGSGASTGIIEIHGQVLTELQKLSAPLVAIQFTHRSKGEMVSTGFSYTAKAFEDTVVDFAEVDLSHPANVDWNVWGEGCTFGNAILDPSTYQYTLTCLHDVPAPSDEMALFFRGQYTDMVVFPDIDRLGMRLALDLHMAAVDALDDVLQGLENDNNNDYDDNNDNNLYHGRDDGTMDSTASPVVSDHHGRPREGDNELPTTTVLQDDKLPSITASTSSLKVGDSLTRPQTLISTDGSTTLSLAGHASIVIQRPTTCPAGVDVNPVVPPPLPRCPAPSFVDGVDNHAEEGASVLLPANARKVRKLAEMKTAETGNTADAKGPAGKFFGFFGRRATTVQKNVKGDKSEDSVDGREGMMSAADDDGNGGGHTEGKDNAAPSNGGKGKDKGAGGWFAWKRWSGRKVEASLDEGVGENLDGEVVLVVSDVGGLEVTYNGVRVISKSGPRKWEWVNRVSRFPRGRKRSNDYELRVVRDGFDVCLGEERVWGAAVPSPCPAPDEP